jgi:hypothetical protein
MYFSLETLGLHFDTILVWGMLMAFLLNLYFYTCNIRVEKSLVVSSTIMFLSYFLSNHYLDLAAAKDNFYLALISYDLITLSLIYFIHKSFGIIRSVGFKYILIGLIFNSLLNCIIHIDIMVLSNREQWWYWSFYSIGINTVDLLMACALIMNRDYLGLIRLYKFITTPIRKKAFS